MDKEQFNLDPESQKLKKLINSFTKISNDLTKSGNIYSKWNFEKKRLNKYYKEDKISEIKDEKLKRCLEEIWCHYEDSLIKTSTYIKKQLYNDPISAKIKTRIVEIDDISVENTYELEELINLKNKEEIKILVNTFYGEKIDEKNLKNFQKKNSFKNIISFLEGRIKKIEEFDIENKLNSLDEEIENHKEKFNFFDLLTEIFIKLEHQNKSLGINYPYNLNECLSKISSNSFDILEKENKILKERRILAEENLEKLQNDYLKISEEFAKFKDRFFEQITMLGDLEEKFRYEKFNESNLKNLIEFFKEKKSNKKNIEQTNEKLLKNATDFMKILTERLDSVEKISKFELYNAKALSHRRQDLFNYYAASVKDYEIRMLKSEEFTKNCLKNLLNSPVFLRDKLDNISYKNIQVDQDVDNFSKHYSYYSKYSFDNLRYYNEIRIDDNPLEIDFKEALVPIGDLSGNDINAILIENSMALVSAPGKLNCIVNFGDEIGIEKSVLNSKVTLI